MSYTVTRTYRRVGSDDLEREELTVTKDQLGPTMWMMGVPEVVVPVAVRRLMSEGTVEIGDWNGPRLFVTWKADDQ